jgi:SAM-dependent methyltransferase
MNKISTKYFNALFQYINTFEEEDRHPAFASQFETVIEVMEFIKTQTKDKKLNVLDLGCGLGNVLYIAKEILGKDNKYVGVDNNQTYLDVAKAVDGTFHLINTDLLGKATQKLISNADIIYCYIPMKYKDMISMYAVISHFSKKGSYFICNDETNQPKLSSYEKIKRFEGFECCNKTDITIYRKKQYLL